MKKAKAITLLSVISVLLAVLAFITFVRFPIGVDDFNSILGTVKNGYDIDGGVAYTLTLKDENVDEVEDINEVMDTLAKRLNALGYNDYTIKALKNVKEGVEDYSIRIVTVLTDSIDADMETVAMYGSLKFYGGKEENPTTEIMNEKNAVAKCEIMGNEEYGFQVAIQFSDYGYEALEEAFNKALSEDASSKFYLKLTLGEKDILSSSLTLADVTDKTIYVPCSNEAEAKQRLLQIGTGGLDYQYDYTGVEISPMFGENTLTFAYLSVAIVAFVALVSFLVMFKGSGIIAAISVIALLLGEIAMAVAIPGIYVSIGGIIGAIVAVLLAVDGLIIVIKRINEELAKGKTVVASIKTGYRRSLMPVLGTNLIAGLISLLLFLFTSGTVRSFAIMAGVGAVLAAIAVLLFSRLMFAVILPLTKDKEKFLKSGRAE